MRTRLRNKIGTAHLRKPAAERGSASHLRLVPPESRGSPPYNDARVSKATDLAGQGEYGAAPGGGVVVFLAEHRVRSSAPGGPGIAGTPGTPAPTTSVAARRGSRAAGRVLLVETDGDYAALTAALLRRDGWEVEVEADGHAALKRLHADGISLILVDTAAAALESGGSLLPDIRSASDAPVIVLSRQEDHEDVVELAVRAADYDLVKPFSPRRFRAAVRAVTRRGRIGGSPAQLPAEVRVGDVTMSFGRLEVVVGDRRVELSPREFALLHLLLAHPGTVFTREELARLAWGWRASADSRAVDNAVRRLRQKIEPNPKHPRYIATERGAGYRFNIA